MSVEILIRKAEPIEKSLRRLKKKLLRESILVDAKAKRFFEKPSVIRRRKKKVSAFNNMLRVRHENA